jgi:hypothetical protein
LNPIRLIGLATAVAALAVAPGVAEAVKPTNPGSQGKGSAKRCAKQVKRGLVVKGTFVSGDATTVELLVTKVNKHAKAAGYDPGETVSFTPSKGVSYVDYEASEPADSDDRVRVVGRAVYTKKKCSGGPATVFDSARKAKVFDNDDV